MIRHLTIACGLILVLLNFSAHAQQQYSPAKNFVSSGDIFGTRNFIENKGQFENPLNKEEKILFVYEHAGEKMYFTAKGVIYELRENKPLSEKEMEELERGKFAEVKPAKSYFVKMDWLDANQNISAEAGEAQGHYFTYGSKDLNSYTFKKITYKNVYDKIDIEYTIPADKEFGVKYSVILHPGADHRKVQLLYSGEVKKIRMGSSGDVIIKTPLEDITERAPKSFYSDGEPVQSTFSIKGNILQFELQTAPDPNKDLIIDPWVTTISSLLTTNAGHDVDYDFVGNTYVYGGSGPSATYKCAKYNSSGVLQWTFSGTVTSPSWSANYSWRSGIALDRSLGKTYMGRLSVPNAVRLDASGNYDNFISSGLQLAEGEDLAFACNGDLIGFGGAYVTPGSLAASSEIMSITTGSVYLYSNFQPSISSCCVDVVDYAVDATGTFFVMYGSGGPSNFYANKIAKVATSFTTNVWTQPTGYSSFNETSNSTSLGGGGAAAGCWYNSLDVNMNYLYYYDGLNLEAINKGTGGVIASTTVAGQTLKQQAGIAVDECDNIYLGGIGSILCYNFNGTSFSILTPIALGSTVTSQYVYDIILNKSTKTLYVSGSGFLGSYSAVNSLSCSALSLTNACSFGQFTITASSTSITCANLGSATVTPVGGIGPYTYTWIPSNQTSSVATGLSPGTYTVIVHDSGGNFTYTSNAVFTPLVPLSGNVSTSFIVPCYGAATATAGVTNLAGGSGAQSYLWTNGTVTVNTPTVSSLGAGNYSVTVTDALTGCIFSPTFTIYQPAQLTAFLTASSPTSCTGNTITMNAVVAGGTPGAYTYSWTGGPSTSSISVSQNIPGTYIYTMTGRDVSNCTVVTTGSVGFVAHPVISVTNASICPLETATLVPSGAVSYTWNNSISVNNFTANPLSTTVYSVTGAALGCSGSATAAVILKALPNALAGSNSPRCVNNSLQLFANGGSSYFWNGPLSFSSFAQNPVLNSVGLTHSGVYNVTVTAANGCTASSSASVTVNPNPTVSASGATVCTTQTLNLSSTSFVGASFSWSGPFGFSSASQNPSLINPPVIASGNYTVTATSVDNCTNTAVTSALVIPPPSLSAPLSSHSLCAQALNASPNSIILTPSGANSYTLLTPLQIVSSLNPPYSLSPVAPYQPGIATTTLFGWNGYCSSSITSTFIVVPNPVITVSQSSPIICEGQNFTFNTTGANTFSWSPAASLSLGNNGVLATAHPSLSTLYSIVGSSLGCNSAMINASLTVQPLPTVSVTPTQSSICLEKTAELVAYGSPASYFWSPPNGLNVTSGSTVIAKPISDQVYTVTASVYNCARSAVTGVTVLALPKPLAFVSNPSVCVNETVSLNGSGGVGYLWEGPDHISFVGETVTFSPTGPQFGGSYKLTVTDIHGCVNSTQTFITVKELPFGALSGSMQACVPFCPDLKFSSVSSVSLSSTWVLRQGQSPTVIKNFQGNNFSHCFTTAGEFVLTGSTRDLQTNCINTQSFIVNAFEKPQADFSWLPEKPIEKMDEVLFVNKSSGEDQSAWSWSFASDKNFNSKKENFTYLFEDAGTYPVALVVKNNSGCSDTVVKVITIEPDFLCFVPNAFTPNNDSHNEFFTPVLRGVSRYSFSIFNRWGERVFQTSDPSEGWDGTFKGESCKQDVYIYKINLTTIHGEAKEIKGQVNLIR